MSGGNRLRACLFPRLSPVILRQSPWQMIYLDHAATTPMRPEVWEAMAPFARDNFGNSSGVHSTSRRAKNALESAREELAAVIGARPLEIVFTSGGTESDNLALKGAVWGPTGRSGIVTVATEHEAVLESADLIRRTGSRVEVVGVDRHGKVDGAGLSSLVDSTTAVVSVMLVNNETGVIQDIPGLAALVKRADAGALFHTDAVQAFSSQHIDVDDLGVDLLTITGHKFGGPKGAGALYVREGTPLEPLIHGGGQELGRRSGTHDVAGAVGLARAAGLAAKDRDRFNEEIREIRDGFERRIQGSLDDAVLNSPSGGRSPQHSNIRFPGVRNETLLMRLDQEGVAASAGAACQSGAATVSHVLEAMGLTPDQARESVRFTFGWTSSGDDASKASDAVIDLVGRLRR